MGQLTVGSNPTLSASMRKYSLELVVSLCGLSVMILELVGSRLLAPFVGISIVVWSALIGIILAALSLGYFYGGKIADGQPEAKVLSKIIFLASIVVCLIVGLKFVLFDLLKWANLGIAPTSIILSLALFALPSTLLGMVSPFAARLKTDSVKKVGGTVGNLYALSTAGSIAGTFLAGFYLIATFTLTQIIIAIALILLSCSLLLTSNKQSAFLKAAIFSITLILTLLVSNFFPNPRVISKDTQYNSVTIYESRNYKDGRPIRIMSLDNKLDSAMYLDSDELVFDYTKFYRLAYAYNPNIKKILVIGGAGYSVPKDFLKRGVQVDVVELDPELTKLAEDYFNLPKPPNRPSLTVYHEDGRTFLNRAQENQYDAILVDAFKSYSIPYQLTTTQSVTKMKDLLKPGGVVLANVISSIEGSSGTFLQAEYMTFKQSFSEVDIYPVTEPDQGQSVQNLMLVGSFGPGNNPSTDEINSYQQHLWKQPIKPGPILTDDFAPVDQMMLATML